jgi:hypothetical protein
VRAHGGTGSRQDLVRALSAVFNDSTVERFFLGIGEEAGEVQGAYNKWCEKRTDKPHTVENVLEEMGQLVGCVFLAAYRIGYTDREILALCDEWLVTKRQEILSLGR